MAKTIITVRAAVRRVRLGSPRRRSFGTLGRWRGRMVYRFTGLRAAPVGTSGRSNDVAASGDDQSMPPTGKRSSCSLAPRL